MLQLGAPFENSLEAPHVVNMQKQVRACAIATGPDGFKLQATYRFNDNISFQVSNHSKDKRGSGITVSGMCCEILGTADLHAIQAQPFIPVQRQHVARRHDKVMDTSSSTFKTPVSDAGICQAIGRQACALNSAGSLCGKCMQSLLREKCCVNTYLTAALVTAYRTRLDCRSWRPQKLCLTACLYSFQATASSIGFASVGRYTSDALQPSASQEPNI